MKTACAKMFNDISRQSSLWNKKQIFTARTKIAVAMIHELIARGKIMDSLQNLNETMEILFGQTDSDEISGKENKK